MRITRKILSVVLSILMLMSVFSIGTSAMTIYVEDFGFSINSSTNEATIVEYNGNDSDVLIPTKVYGYDVIALGDALFSGNNAIVSVNIPSCIRSIGDSVFSNCTSIVNITIPKTVTSVGKNIFMNCSTLKKVEFNANIAALPKSTFQNCTSLSDVVLSDTIEQIENFAFYNCESLGYVPSAENLTHIGQSAFYNSGVKEFNASMPMTTVERYSFANCKNLTKVYLPNEITSIDSTAFKNSDSITIYCYRDSYAHTYAVANSIDFVLLSLGEDSGILGDTDGDGIISVMDATLIQQALVMFVELSDDQSLRADVNADGGLSIIDATLIQFYLVQLETGLPIGEPIA